MKIIWNILVIDSSGTLVYSWLHPQAPKEILKKYEPTMIAGFISAIIKFGHEIIASPQRIDFGEIAMSFFPLKIQERVFWFTILSDISDPRPATLNFLKKFVEEAEELLLEVSAVEGFSILSEDVEKNLNRIVKKILKKSTRFLPEIRSDDIKALPLSILTTFLLTMFLGAGFYYIYMAIPPDALSLITTALLAQYCIVGIIAGIISGRGLAGALAAYIASALSPIIYGASLIQVLIVASSLSVWSGIIGLFTGSYINSRKLTFLPPK